MYYMRVSTRHRDTQHLGSTWCRSERVLTRYRPLHTHPYTECAPAHRILHPRCAIGRYW